MRTDDDDDTACSQTYRTTIEGREDRRKERAFGKCSTYEANWGKLCLSNSDFIGLL